MKNRKFKVIRKEYWEMETIIEAPTADKAEEIIMNKLEGTDIDSVMEKENAFSVDYIVTLAWQLIHVPIYMGLGDSSLRYSIGLSQFKKLVLITMFEVAKKRKENGYEIHWELYLDRGYNTHGHYSCFNC